MANQPTPVIDAVQDREVEKVIFSGTAFQSSILGPGAYRITPDSTPLFYTAPVISGVVVPPSTLTCDTGAFHSSPRATITYQWKKDTVNAAGETSQTIETTVADVGVSFTCEVTITNSSGSDNMLSNALVMEALIPTNIYECDVYALQGLDAPGRQDMTSVTIAVISGLAQIGKADMNEGSVAVITGFAHTSKIDVNEAEIYAITGMQGEIQIDMAEMEAYVMTGIQGDLSIDINECDANVLQIFEDLGTLPIGNAAGGALDMDSWTMDLNSVTMVTSAPGWSFDTNRTGRVFKGEDAGQGVNSQMSQVVDIDSGLWADMDTGRCMAILSYSFYAERHYDYIVVTMEAMDAADGVLATQAHQVGPYPNVGQYDDFGWVERRSAIDDMLQIPALTRKINFIVLFVASNSGSAGNNGYIDNFVVDLLKLE